MPGYYGAEENDGVHVGDDLDASDAALRRMKERVASKAGSAAIRLEAQRG